MKPIHRRRALQSLLGLSVLGAEPALARPSESAGAPEVGTGLQAPAFARVLQENKATVLGVERVKQLLAEMLKTGRSDAQITEALFLMTIGRLPMDKETDTIRRHLAGIKDRSSGHGDILWALLNSRETIMHIEAMAKTFAAQRGLVGP